LSNRPDEHGRPGRPQDRLIAVYAVASGAALLFAHRPPYWLALAGAHAVAALIGFGVLPARSARAAIAQRWPRLAAGIADWYPFLLVPILYAELPLLNTAVYGGMFFDDVVIGWEQSIFGGQPSRTWAIAMPIVPVSELLHAAYLSYYFLIIVPPLLLFLSGKRREFRAAVFALMLTFVVHYLFFVYFPVQGPRYLFPAPGGPIADGWMYQLAHRVLEAGSSQGAAFPSSHVGVGVAQIMIAIRYLRRAALPIALLATGLAAGAVYGGFHYATDVVAGALLGACTSWLALRLRERR
jgi:membrane-associated phospholipid phosphatase